LRTPRRIALTSLCLLTVARMLPVVVPLLHCAVAAADVRGEWRKDRFPILQKGVWGYIDDKGHVVIPPRFEEAAYFNDGLACVRVKHKYGYIDKSGKFVIPPRYDRANSFREGVAWVEGKAKGFIDKTGMMAIKPPTGYYCREFRYGVAVAMPYAVPTPGVEAPKAVSSAPAAAQTKPAEPTGQPKLSDLPVDWQSPWSSEPEVSVMPGTSPAEAPAPSRPKVGYIDKTGSYVIPPQFDDARDFEWDIAAVEVDKKWGFIDKTGHFVIEPQFDGASYVSEGAAVVKKGEHYAFIDKTGKRLFDTEYDDAQSFVEGLAGVKTDGRWGFIDKAGKQVIPFKFEQVSAFFNGMASVMLNGKYGYIDKSGKLAIPAKYGYTHFFLGSLAAFHIDPGRPEAGIGYLNRSGKIVWPPAGRK